jgi:hypothetical protein
MPPRAVDFFFNQTETLQHDIFCGFGFELQREDLAQPDPPRCCTFFMVTQIILMMWINLVSLF